MIQRLQALLKETQCAAIFSPENRRYYTGMNTSNGLLAVSRDFAVFYTDFRYITAAKARLEPQIPVRMFEKSVSSALETFLGETGCQEVLYEEERLCAGKLSRLKRALPSVAFLPGEDLIFSPRAVKTEEEVSCIAKAQAIADRAFGEVCRYISSEKNNGLTEKQIALFLEFEMRKNGSGKMPFPVIVASGENSACPHSEVSGRVIQPGDFITMDFGATWRDYCSDMTRTVAVDRATEKQREVYDLVFRAQHKALDGIRAGICGNQADALARDVIVAAGYGKNFGHSLGHGVGIEIHEMPAFSPNYQAEIPCGTVISVEPGVYLAGEFGVRIEDLVVVRPDGVQNLANSPKELLIL